MAKKQYVALKERLDAERLISLAGNAAASRVHLMPVQLLLRFLLLFKCRCCRSFFVTRTVTLFDNGNVVCNCTKCGARRRLSADEARAFNKFSVFLIALLVVLCISIGVALVLN